MDNSRYWSSKELLERWNIKDYDLLVIIIKYDLPYYPSVPRIGTVSYFEQINYYLNPPGLNEDFYFPKEDCLSDNVFQILKDKYFSKLDISRFETGEGNHLKPEPEKQKSPTKESEKEEIRRLMQKYDIKKGQAKDIRIAYLYDDEKLDYFKIGELLGFEYHDETQASNNLRGRATKGRYLRKQYNE